MNRLDEIKDKWDTMDSSANEEEVGNMEYDLAHIDIPWLVIELSTVQAENAKLREVVDNYRGSCIIALMKPQHAFSFLSDAVKFEDKEKEALKEQR